MACLETQTFSSKQEGMANFSDTRKSTKVDRGIVALFFLLNK